MRSSDLSPNEYGAFYQAYIDLAGDLDLLKTLRNSGDATLLFLESIPESKYEYAYAEGKWTIKEIIQHLIDTERIFAYRALRLARQDSTDIPGFDHDSYVPASKANERTKKDLLKDYKTLRKSTISLYQGFDPEMLAFIGTANQYPISARALAFIMAGHETHHLKVLSERYL
ncbi:MAG: DinB family protein [Bacteroidia bacterium]|nr:DinB family protein [Bacteroidia bacterium]MBT8270286.1 DinB family protein [Bacteroidia bacterium]MBT8287545.1 DinB family protein [Bacteroidia bacterium]NNF82288.1 DinB family protein [Flavobacteriaceae bacterium]NNK69809.1 DinB family protein [Flavobacteriaceae bacterium]